MLCWAAKADPFKASIRWPELRSYALSRVIAIRYSVYAKTAAQFVAHLCANLAQGHSVGDAVTLGRRQLAADSQRKIAFAPHYKTGWCRWSTSPPPSSSCLRKDGTRSRPLRWTLTGMRMREVLSTTTLTTVGGARLRFKCSIRFRCCGFPQCTHTNWPGPTPRRTKLPSVRFPCGQNRKAA